MGRCYQGMVPRALSPSVLQLKKSAAWLLLSLVFALNPSTNCLEPQLLSSPTHLARVCLSRSWESRVEELRAQRVEEWRGRGVWTSRSWLQLRGGTCKENQDQYVDRSDIPLPQNATEAQDIEEVLEMCAQLRSRIPTDEQVAADPGKGTSTKSDPQVEQNLRDALRSFQIDVEGMDEKDKKPSPEEEDEYGPILLLREFWEGGEAEALRLPDSCIRAPRITEGLGGQGFHAAAINANSEILENADNFPSLCGADEVQGFPENSPPEPKKIAELVATCFHTPRFRQRLSTMLELVADGEDIHPGFVRVAFTLSLVLPLASAARVLSVMHSRDHYLQGYWTADSLVAQADAQRVAKAVSQDYPAVAERVKEAGQKLEELALKHLTALALDRFDYAARYAILEGVLKEGKSFLLKLALQLICSGSTESNEVLGKDFLLKLIEGDVKERLLG